MNGRTLFNAYSKATGALAFVCMIGIVVLTSLQVISRYVLQSALFWPEEAARFLLILITFLIAGLSYERGEMIGVTAVTRVLNRRAALIVAVIANLSALALLIALVWYGWAFAQMNAIQHAAALGISMFWVYLAVPAGLAVLALHVFAGLMRSILELIGGEEPAA